MGIFHVNVMHKYPTKEVSGWARPGSVPMALSTTERSVTRRRTKSFVTSAIWSLRQGFERLAHI